MSIEKSNKHPLDEHIKNKMELLNIEYDAVGLQTVQNMLQVQGGYTKPVIKFDFSKFLATKIIVFLSLSFIILAFVTYYFISSASTKQDSSPEQNINQPKLIENHVDSSNVENNLQPNIINKTIPINQDSPFKTIGNSKDNILAKPNTADSTNVQDISHIIICSDSLQIINQKDSIIIEKKKHIFW